MFFEDYSTSKLGICYGGEERPAEGELSEAAKREREEQDVLEEQHRLEVLRAFQTLNPLMGGLK